MGKCVTPCRRSIKSYYGVLNCLLLACGACSTAPSPATLSQHDPTSDGWYGTATEQLAALSKNASEAYAQGKTDAASALIEQGETVAARLMAVPRPTLPAAQAASDLDDLYGRMLFKNRHYGWARLQFQKNLARWKHWQPQTADARQRLRAAESAINLCDSKIEKP